MTDNTRSLLMAAKAMLEELQFESRVWQFYKDEAHNYSGCLKCKAAGSEHHEACELKELIDRLGSTIQLPDYQI